MKTKIICLLTIAIGNLAILFILSLVSSNIRNTRYGFIRYFAPHPTQQRKTIFLPANFYYIAGADNDKIYLGNSGNPSSLLVADTSGFFYQRKLSVSYPKPTNPPASLRISVEDSTFYVQNGVIPILLKGELKTGLAKRYTYDSSYFSEFIPIGSKTAILRTMSRSLSREVLAKLSPAPPHIKTSTSLLQKQVDGIFCTDGLLHYDQNGHLVYVYFYRNQFIVADTNLNLLYRGKTIDTISQAQIRVARITSDDTYTLAAPPLHVNKESAVYGNWLFVHSALLAQNEDRTKFDQASAIDVYNLKNGKYKFSFYIFDKDRNKVLDFRVKGTTLFVLFENCLVIYHLNSAYFESY